VRGVTGLERIGFAVVEKIVELVVDGIERRRAVVPDLDEVAGCDFGPATLDQRAVS